MLAGNQLGTEFWLAFPARAPDAGPASHQLVITAPRAASGVVETHAVTDPGTGAPWRQSFSVDAGASTTISLPDAVEVDAYGLIQQRGIHVTADSSVSVAGHSGAVGASDGFLGIPVDALGQRYRVSSYPNATAELGSQFTILATADDTNVVIWPRPGFSLPGTPAGQTIQVTLDAGETYQLGAEGQGVDLTGTEITGYYSDIAVFSGSAATRPAHSRGASGYLVEQMQPVEYLSSYYRPAVHYAFLPSPGRGARDVYRVMAPDSQTTVTINNRETVTLGWGESFERSLNEPVHLEADWPLIVTAFTDGGRRGFGASPPTMTLITEAQEFTKLVSLRARSDAGEQFINLVTRVGSPILLDGAAIAPNQFRSIGGSEFVGAQLRIAPGDHTLSSDFFFTATQYAFDDDRAAALPLATGPGRDSTLSGTVFEDLNSNGQQDPNEPGVAGVTLTLLIRGSNLNQEVRFSEMTDGQGRYQFPGLWPEYYQLSIAAPLPAPYEFSITVPGDHGGLVDPFGDQSVSIDGDSLYRGYNYLLHRPASISGYVFVDENGDGARDGDTPLPGVEVRLLGTRTDVQEQSERFAVTDANGRYEFSDLPPGTYVLSNPGHDDGVPAELLDGWNSVGTAGGGYYEPAASIGGIVPGSGQAAEEYNFGKLRPAQLSGYVYLDADDDGVFDPEESPLEGVFLSLLQEYNAPLFLNPTLATVQTDAAGRYEFTNIPPGNRSYRIVETQPRLLTNGKLTVGSPGGVVSTQSDYSGFPFEPPVEVDPYFRQIYLPPGFVGQGYNFGERADGWQVAGTVAWDRDGDGIADPYSLIAGIEVILLEDGLGIASTITDAQGDYFFSGLTPGRHYTVTCLAPGLAEPAQSQEFDYLAGQAHLVDFVQHGGRISGQVFDDYDNDGQQDADEPRIQNVTVALAGYDLDGPRHWVVQTDETGSFNFFNLPAGDFVLAEADVPGLADGGESHVWGSILGNDIFSISLNPGQHAHSFFFGERSASISGYVAEYDRLLDGSIVEQGNIVGVNLALSGYQNPSFPFGATNVSLTTDIYGHFTYRGLLAGDVLLAAARPTGYGPFEEITGSAGGVVLQEAVMSVRVEAGEQATGYKFLTQRGAGAPSNWGGVYGITVVVGGGGTTVIEESSVPTFLKFSNDGRTVQIDASLGDESLDLRVGEIVSVGRGGQFTALGRRDGLDRVDVSGLDASDQIEITGSGGDEQWESFVDRSQLTAGNLTVTTAGASEVTFDGGGGADTVTLYDTPGSDSLSSDDGQLVWSRAVVAGGTVVLNAAVVRVISSGGGDWADLWPGSAPLSYVGRPEDAQLTTAAQLLRLRGFDNIIVHGSASDSALATLYDSPDDDWFSNGDGDLLSGPGYSHQLYGFDAVRVLASGGQDRATLYGTEEVDELTAELGRLTLASELKRTALDGFDRVLAVTDQPQDRAVLLAVDYLLELDGPWNVLE